MSNGTDRKSMDDVLASIRRIVRAEKEPEPGERPPGAEQPARREDQPLVLTPDMRMDAGSVEPEAISRPSDGPRFPPTPPDSAPAVDSSAGAGVAGAGVAGAGMRSAGPGADSRPGGSGSMNDAPDGAGSIGGDRSGPTAGGGADAVGPAPAGAAGRDAGAGAPDEETLRRLIREVLITELTSGGAENAVRGIIRDELMNGEIGANISQNVIRLIQSEVGRALEDR